MATSYSRINKEFPIDRLYKCQRKKSQSHTEVIFGWYVVRTSEDIVGEDGNVAIRKGSWLVQQNWWSECTRATLLANFKQAQRDFHIPKKSLTLSEIEEHQNNGSEF